MPPNRQRFFLIDPAHPFYRPLWVRLAIVAVVVLLTIWEIIRGDGFFMVISLALAIYCINMLLIRYRPPEDEPSQEGPPENRPDAGENS